MNAPQPRRTPRFLIPLLVLAMLSASAPAVLSASPAEPPADVPLLPQSAKGLEAGLAGKPEKAPPGLDTALARIAERAEKGDVAGAKSMARENLVDLEGSRARVIVVSAARDLTVAKKALAFRGAVVRSSYGKLISAEVPLASLARLAADGAVLAVRQPAKPRPFVTSEGVAEMGADALHTAGTDGTGVKVGIIDAGFEGYTGLLGTELPSSVVTWTGTVVDGAGSGVHGTACAETAHDVAPGASLYLARVDDEVDLGNAVEWMKTQDVDVISHSMGWYGTEGGDGTGLINGIVDGAVASGIFWSNAAGNDRKRHWMGDFTDADADGILNWDGTAWNVNTFWAPADWPIIGFLWWQDSWTMASRDFDFYLFYWTGSAWSQVANSVSPQEGFPGDTPVEAISYMPATSGVYGWVVHKYDPSAPDAVDFDLHSWYHDLDDSENPNGHFFDHGRSISVPADNQSSGFVSVAAVGRAAGFLQEDYSAEGPNRLGQRGIDISGPSSTTNSVYAPDVFSGTSSSAPHVAGVAALVKQMNPTFTPAQTEADIAGNAYDRGAVGPDNVYGYGVPSLPVPGTVSMSLAPASTTISYGGTANLACTALDGVDPLGGTWVSVWRSYDDVDYQQIDSGVLSGGTYAYPAKTADKAYYKMKVRNSGTESNVIAVTSKVYLPRPVAPRSARRGRTFRTYGYLKPRHTSGSYTVKLQFYRYESRRWKLRKSVYARNADYSSYTKYTKSTSLPYRGKWKVRAYSRADSKHALTTSSYDYLTVK